jgi:hypothetical protein
VLGSDDLVTGLLVSWPALLLAFGVPVIRGRPDLIVALTAVLFGVVVVLTQYPDGGGAQWGGRFLTPALVLLAALVAPAVRGLMSDRSLRLAVLAVIVAPVLAGGVATTRLRSHHHEVVDDATASGAPVVITEVPALPRLGWSVYPETRWLWADPGELDHLVAQLHDAGITDVGVHGFLDVGLSGDVEAVSPVLRVVHGEP